ncbi:MAG TPA: anthranilate phosphoribosyltransferase [Atribacteraceae bacterium]|nr:anthranilate phosphoribosyltransferase [Atribacteraceae bacterium]
MTLTLRDVLDRFREGKPFSFPECRLIMNAFLNGDYNSVQTASILTAFHLREVNADELAGFTEALRERAITFVLPPGTRAADNCGTGGDGAGTMNLSSAAALVACAAGLPIVKHGNRAVSSRSGSADFLEALGIQIQLTPEEMREVFLATGFAFLFAPVYHPAIRAVQPVRKDLGIRTLFNLIGPLANPAPVTAKLVGVSRAEDLPVFSQAMARLGYQRALTVWGEPGLDEVSPCGITRLLFRDGQSEHEYVFHPLDLGYGVCPLEAIRGGSAEDNAAMFRAIINGQERGPRHMAVVLNTAALFWVCGEVADLREGCERAEETLNSGQAREFVDRLVTTGSRLARKEV